MKSGIVKMAWILGSLAAGAASAQAALSEAQLRCIRDHEKAYQLHAVSQQLVSLRDNRAAIDAALSGRPELKKDIRYKSVDEAVTAGMAMYREAGGPAKTLAEVKVVDTPCPPGALPPPVVAAAPAAPSAAALAPKPVRRVSHGLGRDVDARHCLTLKTDRAVMACAEKYR